MILDVLLYLISFVLFTIIQSWFLNGWVTCFKGAKLVDSTTGKEDYQGMVFYMLAPKFFEDNKQKGWSKPIYSCPKCVASVGSIVTFWPLVIFLFGFHWIEVYVWVINAFTLVALNGFVYKKI